MGYKASTKQMIHHRESSLRRLLETYKRKHSIIMLIMSLEPIIWHILKIDLSMVHCRYQIY